MGGSHAPVPGPRNDGTVTTNMQSTDIVRVAQQGIQRLLPTMLNWPYVNDRVVTAGDDIA